VMVAVAQARNIATPAGFENVTPSTEAKHTAASLISGEPKAVLLGNAASQHPQAAQLHAVAEWIAQNTDAKFGYLTEAGNTIGGYLANAIPTPAKGANAQQAFAQPRKAYLLLNAEPEFDSHNPQTARAALDQAEMVVAMSAYKHGLDYADVLLPIAPFTETAGTFVNCEGRAQSFNGSVKPSGETRPAWKVLRVLGNLLGLQGFDYETSEAIRVEIIGATNPDQADLKGRLNNFAGLQPQAGADGVGAKLERVADVPIYFTDAIVRRSEPLQQTSDAKAPCAWLSTALAQELGVVADAPVKVTQGQGSAILAAAIDATLPANVVRVSAAHELTKTLGPMFGPVTVERA
jgi:NADH-quinone oxidoreductase subunit G